MTERERPQVPTAIVQKLGEIDTPEGSRDLVAIGGDTPEAIVAGIEVAEAMSVFDRQNREPRNSSSSTNFELRGSWKGSKWEPSGNRESSTYSAKQPESKGKPATWIPSADRAPKVAKIARERGQVPPKPHLN